MTFGRLAIIFASTTSVAVLAQTPQAARLDQARRRDDAPLPGGAAPRHAQPARQRGRRRRVRQAACSTRKASRRTIVGSDPKRPNLIARLKGNGKKKPLLIMGHSDTVTTDEKKWTHPPLSATRDGGYVYGRGTIDDKDNLTGALMTMLLLKRLNVPLDRDVIFVSEAGEEGGFGGGIGYLVKDHFPEIEAEYCLAEGGGVTRIGGQVKYATVQTLEKIPRGIELVVARHLRPRLDSAQVERDRASGRRGRQGRRVAARRPLQRDDRHLLPQAGGDFAARRGEVLPRRAVDRSEGRSRRPTTGCSRTSRAIRRCCGRRCRRTSSPAAIART